MNSINLIKINKMQRSIKFYFFFVTLFSICTILSANDQTKRENIKKSIHESIQYISNNHLEGSGILACETNHPPSPELFAPTDNFYTTNTRPLFVWSTVYDESGIQEYQIFISDYKTSSVLITNFVPDADLPEGEYIWNVRAIDNCTNSGEWSETRKLTIDLLPPTLNITNTTPPIDQVILNNTNLYIAGTAQDNLAGVNYITYSNLNYNASGTFGFATGTTNWWVNVPLTEKTNVIVISAVDHAGNTASQQVLAIHYLEKQPFTVLELGFGFPNENLGSVCFNWAHPAPIGSLVQILSSPLSEPPLMSTNNSYVIIKQSYVGNETNLFGYYNPIWGEFAFSATADWSKGKYITVRTFSSSNIEDSVYYDQSESFVPWEKSYYSLESMINVNVNPSYIIPELEFYASEQPLIGDNSIWIDGFANTGYDDNQLRDRDCFVEWQNLTINQSGTLQIYNNKFGGDIPIDSTMLNVTNIIRVRTVGISDYPDLPTGNWQYVYAVVTTTNIILNINITEPSNEFISTTEFAVDIEGDYFAYNTEINNFLCSNLTTLSAVNVNWSNKFWSAKNISLASGKTNEIIIILNDTNNIFISDSILIEQIMPPATLLDIEITSPTTNDTYSTNNNFIELSGTYIATNTVVNNIFWSNITTSASGDVQWSNRFWGAQNISLMSNQTNEVIITIIDTNKITSTDTIFVFQKPTAPSFSSIQILLPTAQEFWQTNIDVIDIAGVFIVSNTFIDNIFWSNATTHISGFATWSNNYWEANNISLNKSSNNIINVYLVDTNSIVTSDSINVTYTYIKPVLTNFIVICNQPSYIGLHQKGTCEFISPEADVPYYIVWGSSNLLNGSVIGQGVVSNNCQENGGYYNCVHYTITDENLIANEAGVTDDIWLVIKGKNNTYKNKLPRQTYVVPDININGKYTKDVDNDKIYVKFISKNGIAESHGRTIILSNVGVKDKLLVKVKKRLDGNGVTTLSSIIIENGTLGMLKWYGDVEDVVSSGSVKKVIIKGGNLGYLYNKLSKFKHGFVSYSNSMSVTKKIFVKSIAFNKNAPLGGAILGDCIIPDTHNFGVNILINKGYAEANFRLKSLNKFKITTNSKAQNLSGVLRNSIIFVDNLISNSSASINKIKMTEIDDSKIFAVGDINYIITKIAGDSSVDVTNHYPERNLQIIAGITDEILDVVSGNINNPSFIGLIPVASIRNVKIKFISQAVFVSTMPRNQKGKIVPVKIFMNSNRTKETWFINGEQKLNNWDGKQ